MPQPRPFSPVQPLLLSGTLCLLLAACNPSTDQKAATADHPPAAPAAAPASAPGDSPGTWYRQYRGLLPGTTDSITLQLQAWPRQTNDTESAGVLASYVGTTGQLFLLPGDYGVTHSPDSLALADYNPQMAGAQAAQGVTWWLRRQGRELTGRIGDRPVRLREVQPLGSLQFTSRFFHDSIAAFPGQAKSAYAHRSMLALQPVGLATGRLRDNLLRHLRGDTLENQPAPRLPDLWADILREYGANYQRNARELVQQAGKDTVAGYMLRQEEQQLMQVLWNQAPLLSIGYFDYAYTGGAHGMYLTRTVSYDTRTGRPLRYADIFRPEAKPQLAALLDQAARRQFGLTPTDALDGTLLVDHVPVTTNVFLTSGGATFVYPPYEIASFAQGEVQLFIPFSKLRPLLQPELPVGTEPDVVSRR